MIGCPLPNLNAQNQIGVCAALDRMIARMPFVYHTEDPSNIRKLITIESEQLCLLYDELEDVQHSHWVDTASGFALDALGSLLSTPRRAGETDSAFKARLKAVLPTFTGGGTIPHLKKIVAGALGGYGVTEDNVQINDGYLVVWHGPHYEYILKLDGDATDWEGNHNGVEVGAPSYDDSRFDDGLSQPDDVNYIRIPDDSAFDTNDFYLWAWVNTSDVSGTRIIKIKSTVGGSIEWYLRVVNGQVQGKVKLATTDADVDSGTNTLETNKTYFILLAYNDSTKQSTLYIVEDGLQGRMIALSKFTGAAGAGARSLYASADIYLGMNPAVAGQVWDDGWIDHVGYNSGVMDNKLADELAYCAPGLNHYAHFNIEIANFDTSEISVDDWLFAEEEVRKNKAAAIEFDGFSNGPKIESILVTGHGHRYHHTEITFTESLNITYPG
jgi:hypothetical protein